MFLDQSWGILKNHPLKTKGFKKPSFKNEGISFIGKGFFTQMKKVFYKYYHFSAFTDLIIKNIFIIRAHIKSSNFWHFLLLFNLFVIIYFVDKNGVLIAKNTILLKKSRRKSLKKEILFPKGGVFIYNDVEL